MKLLILLTCLCLSACCPEQIVKKAPDFDVRLMQECSPLPTYTLETFSDVLQAKSTETKLYVACKNSHSGLVESIKKYQEEFNK